MGKSAPIKIFDRKIFIGQGPMHLVHYTEPIPVGDFQRLDLGFTIHGMATNTMVMFSMEETSTPETSQDENWASMGPSVSTLSETLQTQGRQGSTSQMTFSGFLPWLRGVLTLLPQPGTSGTIAAEISIGGHLHQGIA